MTSITLKDGRCATLSPLGEKPEFVDRVAAVIFAEWTNFWKQEIGYESAQQVADWLRTNKGADSLPYYAIAHIDDELLGCSGCDATEREGDSRGPWLIDVTVLEKYRGCGAFPHLVTHIMNVQRNRGVSLMYLWTMPSLVKVYEKFGWKYLHDEEWTTEEHGKIPQPTMTVDLTQVQPSKL